MRPPKLKGKKTALRERYPLGEFPREVITAIGRQIIHRLAVGMADIQGDDFGVIFAEAIGGQHAGKPEGVADVSWNGCAWSVKTVKNSRPRQAEKVRLISGRNSPGYSYGMSYALADPQKTGEAILGIWNERVRQARNESDNLRVVVLVRSVARLEFVLFEEEIRIFAPGDYGWTKNKRGNLEGRDIAADRHVFTWQPHGGQFTVIRQIPASAVVFELKRPPVISEKSVLQDIGYEDDWVIIQTSRPKRNKKT